MVFDWDLLQEFAHNIQTIFNICAIENPDNPINSYINLSELGNTQNPETLETVG